MEQMEQMEQVQTGARGRHEGGLEAEGVFQYVFHVFHILSGA